jgi:crotonobetainyl-CoA:carnitine CoA-transferase CaiB-like acyl-CoA transferase
MGDQNVTAAPSGTFDAADGPLNIAANRQEQYETLCHLTGRPDLIADPRFATVDQRKRHRDELNRELNKVLSARSALEWEKLLSSAGVPAARILAVPDMVELEQLAHRQFFTELPFPHPEGGTDGDRRLPVSGNGVLVDGERLHAVDPPPRLGQHNGEVAELIQAWQANQHPEETR